MKISYNLFVNLRNIPNGVSLDNYENHFQGSVKVFSFQFSDNFLKKINLPFLSEQDRRPSALSVSRLLLLSIIVNEYYSDIFVTILNEKRSINLQSAVTFCEEK